MLNFSEEILLLALDDQTGELRGVSQAALSHALAGAVLMELALRNRIDTDLKELIVVSTEPTGDPVMDKTLGLLAASPKPMPIRHWVRTLLELSAEIRETTLDHLVGKGILKREESRFLWVFSTRRYPQLHGEEREEVRARLRRLVLSDEIPEPRDVVLISLLEACRLSQDYFSEAELPRALPRLRLLARMDLIGQQVTRVLREIEGELATAWSTLT